PASHLLFCSSICRRPRDLHSFPTRRSSDLGRKRGALLGPSNHSRRREAVFRSAAQVQLLLLSPKPPRFWVGKLPNPRLGPTRGGPDFVIEHRRRSGLSSAVTIAFGKVIPSVI